jgi:hypothetical protein
MERRVVEGHMPLAAEFSGTFALIFIGAHAKPIAV